ncbi:unnamed protein product [Rhizopus stolonifer]
MLITSMSIAAAIEKTSTIFTTLKTKQEARGRLSYKINDLDTNYVLKKDTFLKNKEGFKGKKAKRQKGKTGNDGW